MIGKALATGTVATALLLSALNAHARAKCENGCAFPTPKKDQFRFAERYLAGQAEAQRDVVRSEDNLPFVRTHGKKTRKVAVLIHGLSDSPCSMAPSADILFEQGYNVVGVLLDGHGTRPEDLLRVQREQWRRTVARTMAQAKYLGDEITLAGFSTGGALALSVLADNDELQLAKEDAQYAGGLYFEPYKIKELILFSPALGIDSLLARTLCRVPGARAAATAIVGYAKGVHSSSCKYDKIALHAACQVDALARDNKKRMTSILDEISGKGIRTLLAFWEGDKVVRIVDLKVFQAQLPSDKTTSVVWAKQDRPSELGHNLAIKAKELPALADALARFSRN